MHGGTYSNLAKHYYENLLDIIGNDLKIDYYDINNPEHGAPTDPIGRYRPSKHLLLINPKHIKSDIDFEYAFLHELNHAVFSRAINRKESLPAKAQEAITNLENLVNTLNSDKTFLSLLKETYPDIIGEQGYPVKDVKEFLSYLMNDSTFQQLLNDYKYEGKSLLIKILEYLSNIVGIDINKNSALYEAMKQVTLLIQDIKPTTKSAEQGLKNLASMSKSKVETMQDKINRLATLKVSKPDSDLINNYSEFSKTLPVEQRRILAAKIREGLLIIKCN